MTRFALFAAVLAGVLSAASAGADLPVAPPPREIRPDGSRDPVPGPDAAKAENPLETVERIIKNSKDVGDKLARTDTGTDTRKTQDRILKDIESLIDRQENPPKGGDDKNKSDQKDKSQGKDQKDDKKPSDGMPMGGMQPKDGKDTGGMGMGQPKDGKDPMAGGNGGRKPRAGETAKKDEKEADRKDGKDAGGMAKADPMMKDGKEPGGMAKADPKDMKDPMGGVAGGMPGDPKGGPPSGKPTLPVDDEVAKEVWGHLPDQLRKQLTQYYKEEFMPKYSDLLKMYYSSLANQKPPAEMKK